MSELDRIILDGVEYELAGGGTPAVTYSITNNLTNVTNSNGATSIREERPYTATLAVAQDATLESVSVTMGGTDITATAWNPTTMTINIASVTNDVVITAVASVIIEVPITTWTGSGTSRVSNVIDAREYDAYYEIPFVSDATQLASGVTANSDALGIQVDLFTDAECTQSAGYYFIDTGEISQTPKATDSSCPVMVFDTEYKIAPAGYYIKIYGIKKASYSSNANCFSYLNAYADTVTLKSSAQPEPVEEISNAEATDNDLMQVYAVRSLSTDTIDDTTSYEGVIETVKNAWMTEYGGSIDKIPIIIHTDQHDTMGDATSKAMWEAIDNMISWYDVSKVLNLGDTTNSYDNFDNPLLGDANLEAYLEATENIPYSKRIEVFGNHDCMKIISASLTYIPQAPNYLNPYFKNVMARRTSNNGNWCVTYDPYFNVKYIIYSAYDWLATLSDNGVTTEQYDFLIEEMTKNDGYDIILIGHTDVDIYQEHTGQLAKARYEKTSGSFTDRLGVTHTYDFTGCENDLLVCLHGHSHSDGYNYTETVLSQCFKNYYDSTRPIYFVIVDRANGQLKIWKVTNTPEYTLTTRSFVETT